MIRQPLSDRIREPAELSMEVALKGRKCSNSNCATDIHKGETYFRVKHVGFPGRVYCIPCQSRYGYLLIEE
jgi:hypothetical protein